MRFDFVLNVLFRHCFLNTDLTVIKNKLAKFLVPVLVVVKFVAFRVQTTIIVIPITESYYINRPATECVLLKSLILSDLFN